MPANKLILDLLGYGFHGVSVCILMFSAFMLWRVLNEEESKIKNVEIYKLKMRQITIFMAGSLLFLGLSFASEIISPTTLLNVHVTPKRIPEDIGLPALSIGSDSVAIKGGLAVVEVKKNSTMDIDISSYTDVIKILRQMSSYQIQKDYSVPEKISDYEQQPMTLPVRTSSIPSTSVPESQIENSTKATNNNSEFGFDE